MKILNKLIKSAIVKKIFRLKNIPDLLDLLILLSAVSYFVSYIIIAFPVLYASILALLLFYFSISYYIMRLRLNEAEMYIDNIREISFSYHRLYMDLQTALNNLMLTHIMNLGWDQKTCNAIKKTHASNISVFLNAEKELMQKYNKILTKKEKLTIVNAKKIKG